MCVPTCVHVLMNDAALNSGCLYWCTMKVTGFVGLRIDEESSY